MYDIKHPDLKKALDHWRSDSKLDIDPQVIDLVNSAFFKNFISLTEQMFLIIDQRVMKYIYISPNVETILGYPLEKIYDEGVQYFEDKIAADDLKSWPEIFEAMVAVINQLSHSEIVKSRFSYDYRVRYANNEEHWLLQHNIPLAVDEKKNVSHVLTVITDISPYKLGNNCHCKIVAYTENNDAKILFNKSFGKSVTNLLTRREKEVLLLTAEGIEENEIAIRLNIGKETVKSYRKNLLRKVGARNAPELVKVCYANQLI